jgi:hypothetical protein
MADLLPFPFTNVGDTATSNNGWTLALGKRVNSLAGNDKISGSGSLFGFDNFGTISTGSGRDAIIGIGTLSGITIFTPTGSILTGSGNDTITGSGTGRAGLFGISNSGLIDTGAGNDKISGASSGTGSTTGINNQGIITTGSGKDTINGSGTAGDAFSFSFGISNSGLIDTGDGDDKISGASSTLDINKSGLVNPGIINIPSGSILTGSGNDTITGSSSSPSGWGISNGGTIFTGTGNDTVDALKGGFLGSGTTDLGDNDDILKGFGSGIFKGGSGIDRIFFAEGIYTVDAIAATITKDFITMNVSAFELIGGTSSGSFAFASGTLTVNAAGVGTFV